MARRLAIVLMCLAVLGGCAQPGTAPSTTVPRTASDQTDGDRRAAPRLELAALYYGRGQYETALDEIKQALSARPDMGAAYNLRGLIYGAMGEERLADDSFARALELNPRDADAMHNRGWFHCQYGRYAEADRLFEQALAQPQYRDPARTFLAQGVCLVRAGRLPEAEKKLQRAFELDPGNLNAALNLADVLYRRGDYERARFYVRRVNQREEVINAQSLWLAMRIEHRMGNQPAVDDMGRQLRSRFPQAPETSAYDRGRYDE
jgi:type IV pilus assembly protein PilF